MINPGSYVLAALSLTTALSGAALSPISGLEGALGLSLEARFAYGSGGATCVVTVQTSFDGGTNWIDVARFDFATAAAVKVSNLSGLLSKAVTSLAALGAEGVNDGLLGPIVRAVVTTTGTYANTTLSVRAVAR